MGLTGQRFTLKHKDQVIGMTRTFLDYMKSLRLRAPEAVNPVPVRVPEPEAEDKGDSESDVVTNKRSLDIEMTADGYPIISIAIMEREVSKSECERLIRGYLSQHYCKFLI